jgi:hypothetical protein
MSKVREWLNNLVTQRGPLDTMQMHGLLLAADEVVEAGREVVKPLNEHYHSMAMSDLAEALSRYDKLVEEVCGENS